VETESDHLRDYADVHIYEKNRTNPTTSMNKGFACCSGSFTVLLTNDVFTSDGWLEHLIEPFERKDCAITTLGCTQFNHQKSDKVEEGNWFSLACWKSQGKIFDEQFEGIWDDTDFIMRTFVAGKRFFRSYKTIVEHLVGATHYATEGHQDRFKLYQEKFRNKWAHLIGTEHESKYKELAGL